jgi:hypothetical protein
MLTDKAAWDDDLILRLAVGRLWIAAGNCAEEYRRANQIDPGVEPRAELAGYRNRLAHALPGDLSSDPIWTDTTADLEPILNELHHLR